MKNKMKKQSGFTLIELVIVIVVLGILASFAVPKFGNLVERARIAKVEALSGAVKSAATIAHAQQLAEQVAHDADTTMNGTAITMENRYPDDSAIADTLAEFDSFTFDGAGVFTLDNAGDAGDGSNCSVTYVPAAALGESPTVTTDITDCK
mgnify:CR=1 FL=1